MSEEEIMKKESRLAIPEIDAPERADWERMVREAYCKGSTPLEFALFLQQCQTLDLTPVAGQICQIPFWDKDKGGHSRTTIVRIDGFRVVAQRSGQYRGRLGPFWCDSTGQWRDVWLHDEPPAAAKVGVLREGFSEPVWGVAKWSSFVRRNRQGNAIGPWASMPDVMIAKCAEAQALRAAFSILGGVYEPSEIDRARGEGKEQPALDTNPQSHPPLISEPEKFSGTKQQNEILARLLEGAGIELIPANRDTFLRLKEQLMGTPMAEFEAKASKLIEKILGIEPEGEE